MDKARRKQLVEEYKKIKIMAGVIKITNTKNGKVYVRGVVDLKNRWSSIRMQLDAGRYMNLALQGEWKEYGPDAFAYEVLEEKPVGDMVDRKFEVGQMERAWIEKLRPYGEAGYHKTPVSD